MLADTSLTEPFSYSNSNSFKELALDFMPSFELQVVLILLNSWWVAWSLLAVEMATSMHQLSI